MTNKFICVNDNNDFKKLSLEDNVYFTLRDIFFNTDIIEYSIKANEFNSIFILKIVQVILILRIYLTIKHSYITLKRF